MDGLGTEPHKLRRNDHPDTSHESAETEQSAKYEKLALEIHEEFVLAGCTLDDLYHAFQARAVPRTQFVNRRTGLHQKGLVLDTGTRRVGEAGKSQAVYVARSVLSKEWLEYIKGHPDANNPCLHGGSTLRVHAPGNKVRHSGFLLYVGRTYYPGPAAEDLKCSADTIRELMSQLETYEELEDGPEYGWWRIVRHSTMQVEKEG